MKKIKYILSAISLVGAFSFSALSPMAVFAESSSSGSSTSTTTPTAGTSNDDIYHCDENPDALICKDKDKNITDTVKTTINVILYVLGSLSVVMIIYSGILYVMSGGDANNVTKAKNTLMYSVIGLIVALLAYAIVNFVITTFK